MWLLNSRMINLSVKRIGPAVIINSPWRGFIKPIFYDLSFYSNVKNYPHTDCLLNTTFTSGIVTEA